MKEVLIERKVRLEIYTDQMRGILGQEGAVQSQIDQVYMGGEAQRMDNNLRDKDAHNTALGVAYDNLGFGMQNIGKSVNDVKQKSYIRDEIAKWKTSGIDTNAIQAAIRQYQLTGIFPQMPGAKK